jgi:hypothetical protein
MRALQCTFFSAVLVVFTSAQFEQRVGGDSKTGDHGIPKAPKAPPLEDDIKYVRCDVCKSMALNALEVSRSMVKTGGGFSSASTYLGDAEERIDDLMGTICDADSGIGGWLKNFDIVKDGPKLRLKDQGTPGHCRRECRTLEKACADIIEDIDSELPTELIRTAKDGVVAKGTEEESKWSTKVCTKISTVCRKGKTPPYPEGIARPNEAFRPQTPKEIQAERTRRAYTVKSGGKQQFTLFDELEGQVPPDVLNDEL